MRHWKMVFIAITLFGGISYWWLADWWAYVDGPSGSEPKFTMPWWWQLIESGAIGAAVATLFVWAWWAARIAANRLGWRRTPLPIQDCPPENSQ
jgi:hypothetical protein